MILFQASMGFGFRPVSFTVAIHPRRRQIFPAQSIFCWATHGFPGLVVIWLRKERTPWTVTHCITGKCQYVFTYTTVYKQISFLAMHDSVPCLSDLSILFIWYDEQYIRWKVLIQMLCIQTSIFGNKIEIFEYRNSLMLLF